MPVSFVPNNDADDGIGNDEANIAGDFDSIPITGRGGINGASGGGASSLRGGGGRNNETDGRTSPPRPPALGLPPPRAGSRTPAKLIVALTGS